MNIKNGLKNNLKYSYVLLIFALFLISSNVYAKFSTDDYSSHRSYKFEKYYQESLPSLKKFTRLNSGPQKFAIVIGQNTYKDRPLKTCVNDAKEMAGVFEKNLFVPRSNLRLLLNENANRYSLTRAFNSLSKITRPGDKVYFYYSGHSVRTKNKKTGTKTTSLLFVNGDKMSSSVFTRYINKINAVSILFLDSCYAGGILSKKHMRSADKKSNFSQKTYLVASSKSDEVSMTIPLYNQSRFTYFLTQAISNKRADINKDGRLSLGEVFSYSRKYTLLFGEKYGSMHNPILYGYSPFSLILNEKYIPPITYTNKLNKI